MHGALSLCSHTAEGTGQLSEGSLIRTLWCVLCPYHWIFSWRSHFIVSPLAVRISTQESGGREQHKHSAHFLDLGWFTESQQSPVKKGLLQKSFTYAHFDWEICGQSFSTCWSAPQMLVAPRAGWGSSLELNAVFLHGWQIPKNISHQMLPTHISRVLDWECDSQNLNKVFW